MPGHGKPVGGGQDGWTQGGPGKAPKDPPAMGHGGPIRHEVVEFGGQWEPRGDPRFRPGPGSSMGHGAPRGMGLGQGTPKGVGLGQGPQI